MTHSEFSERLARMKATKMAYCDQHKIPWDDAVLPPEVLNTLGLSMRGSPTKRKLEVIRAAIKASNPRGEVSVIGILEAMGLDPQDQTARSKIGSRIHQMQSAGTFPFQIVSKKEWR